MAVGSSDGFDELHHIDEVVAQGSLDFKVWTFLISKVEQIYLDDLDKITLVYDAFLSEFPLCYGYWKKYAEHKTRLCGVENAAKIFEQAVEVAPYSVDLWFEYCRFGISSFEDPNDVCRLFDRGLLLVGKDYLSHKIWDKYIEYEFSQQHWNSLANIYIQTLKFPTKKLNQYYESFKKLITIWEEEMRFQGIACTNMLSDYETNGDIKASKTSDDAEISQVISDLHDSSTRSKALFKYRSIGEQFYQRTCVLNGKVQKFERNISRSYFHVKSLDDSELQNWHQYLDFVEAEGDFDWAMKLYERCLISCANYPEFWMRYVDHLESKGARELAANALKRATLIFLKNAPQIHLFSAWFKEEMGDVDGLRAAFAQCDQQYEPYLIEFVRNKANMERRLGNYISAHNIYKAAIDMAAEKRPDLLPMLYLHFARLQLMVTNNVDTARDVLLNGIQRVPHSKLLLKELILFAFMHEGALQVDILNSIMTKALNPESDISASLSAEDREDISRSYLEFVDFCGSIHDVRRAWNRHLKLFPHVVRAYYSLKKPSKAPAIWKIINDSEPQNSTGKHVENHLMEKVIEKQDIDHSEPNIDGESQVGGIGDFSLNDIEIVPLEATKTHTEDVWKDVELSDLATIDNSLSRDDSKLDVFHQEQDQKNQQLNPSSSDNPSSKHPNDESQNLTASPASEFEPSLSNKSRNIGDVSPRITNAAGRDKGSVGPSSTLSHNNHSRKAAPHRHEGNWGRLNPSGTARQNGSYPGNSEERRERSLSPRRRSYGYKVDRRHRERSLSPRRHASRQYSEERWHPERLPSRNFHFNNSSRGRRDGTTQNENHMGNNSGKTLNFQQQSMGFASQTQPNAQAIAHSQGQMNQCPAPLPSNEQTGNLQNSLIYNQMWQYYYYNQQQQLLQQQPYQQQQQMQSSTQQPIQVSQQETQQIHSQQQQVLNLQYQQQQILSQQPQFQQHQQPSSNEQPQSQEQQLQLQQQMQLPQQQLFQQMQQQQAQIQQQQQVQIQPQQQQVQIQPQQQQVQIQPQQQAQIHQQEEVDSQQQQQAYQYQQLQQQQYLLYLQQLQQYQYSQQQQQQPGLVKDQQSGLQQQQHLTAKQDGQEKLQELQYRDEGSQSEPRHYDHSLQVDQKSSNHGQQGPEVEGSHNSLSSGVASLPQPHQLPKIERTDM